jgi:hypothetical protein
MALAAEQFPPVAPCPLHARSLPEPQLVRRRVSERGSVMIARQRVHVLLSHAVKTAEITVGPDTYHIAVDDGSAVSAARTSSDEIRRHKASHNAVDARGDDPAAR